jgi:hypothetical protein
MYASLSPGNTVLQRSSCFLSSSKTYLFAVLQLSVDPFKKRSPLRSKSYVYEEAHVASSDDIATGVNRLEL